MAIQRTQAYEKTALFRFFTLYIENFWRILIVNLIFFTAVVLDALLIFGTNALFGEIGILNPWTSLLTLFYPTLLGPIIAALTKICRDMVRGVPGFFYTDFIDALKSNYKQSLAISLFQNIIAILLYIALPTYYHNMGVKSDMTAIFYIGFGACLLVAIIVVFMSYYMHMMVVTLKLRVKEIIKNSMIFAFLCLWRNIGLTIILGFITFVSLTFLYSTIISGSSIVWGLFITYLALLFFGLYFYTVSWFSFNPIKKFILDKYYEEHPEETSAGINQKIEPSDDVKEEEEPKGEVSEYVYHNGKMIHRSALETEQLFVDRQEYEKDE